MTVPDEARSLRVLAETSDAIVAGVERELPGWVRRQVTRIVDAWGRLDGASMAAVEEATSSASITATARIVRSLRDLFATDVAAQTVTPLEVVRSAILEPTAVLRAAGIPPVERDEFHERMWPDDVYGLVPATLGDLGDSDLAPLHLAWGMAKAGVLRARLLS
jgi:hypothetical protein